MPYITREDGERFIIPSYRDVLSAKKPALLKKEVMLLSTNYGEYITLQRKNVDQYEAAFSPDPGYLLGETVWHYFKRPKDLIYCEAIPNTTEAILVIVKGGSVYLDGSFPIDSIPDELIIFRTQQNSFEINIYGDIPLSATPEEGKFSLDASSVKSFNRLAEPIFPTLPTIKSFQLRLVDAVLKSQGIGVFPVKKWIAALVVMGLIWMGISYLSSTKTTELPQSLVGVINPFQGYLNAMASPAPTAEIESMTAQIQRLYTIPGWFPVSVDYSSSLMKASVKSLGTKLSVLFKWADINGAKVQIASDGVYVTMPISVTNRSEATVISPVQQILAELVDRVSTVMPGNHIMMGPVVDRGRYVETQFTVNFQDLTLETLNLLAEQFKGLPLVLLKTTFTIQNGSLSGTIVLNALGS